MNAPNLQAIRQRVEAATKGPWKVYTDPSSQGRPPVIARGGYAVIKPDDESELADLEFIAAARTDVPALLDYVEELQAENERLRLALEAIRQWAKLAGHSCAVEFVKESLKTVVSP